jgi:hypothetical protein
MRALRRRAKKGHCVEVAAVFIAGLIDLGFAVFHATFWHLFGWSEKLKASGRLDAAITPTLNALLIYVFTMYGSVLIGFALSGHPVPSILALAGAGFWTMRTLLQPVFFRIWSPPFIILTFVFAIAAVAHGAASVAAIAGHKLAD